VRRRRSLSQTIPVVGPCAQSSSSFGNNLEAERVATSELSPVSFIISPLIVTLRVIKSFVKMSSDPLDTIDLEMELPEEVIFGGEKETEAAGSAGGRPSGPANEKVRGPELEAESDDEEFHPIPSPRRNRKRAAAATGVDMDFNSNLLSEEQEEGGCAINSIFIWPLLNDFATMDSFIDFHYHVLDNEMAGDVESSSDEEGHKGRNHEVVSAVVFIICTVEHHGVFKRCLEVVLSYGLGINLCFRKRSLAMSLIV